MEKDSVEIVLIEDNPTDAELTIRALKKNNLVNNIVWLKDGEEALEYMFCTGRYVERNINYIPRVILLDLKLPFVSGQEVLEKLKNNEHTKKVPVVVMTSSLEECDLDQCYHLGVNSYIVKPIDFDKFTEVVKNLGLYWLLINETYKN